MIGQIGPLVQAGKSSRILLSHIAGGAFGGLTTGVFLGFAAVLFHGLVSVQTTVAVSLLCLILIVAAAVDASVLHLPAIGASRQTPYSWACSFGPLPAAFAWGCDLGMMFTTRVTSYAILALPTYALLSGNLIGTCIVFLVYGVTRSLIVAMVVVRSDHDIGTVCQRLGDSQQARLRASSLASIIAVAAIILVWL